ncbi:unnamed protein product [Cylicocyclus nassatus]|uniref:Glycosyltransferase family 92 protein n=1 Tax=Cylicocyclus nassatus TaxID=53992 RepID=A0AA36M686_CYLNA|nr:unnamed protein product [Cylicocyclus nassatus]
MANNHLKIWWKILLQYATFSALIRKSFKELATPLDLIPLDLFDGHFSNTTAKLFMVNQPVNFVRVPVFRLKPFCNWRCLFREIAEDDLTVWKINPKQIDALRSNNAHLPSRFQEKKIRIGIVTVVDSNTTRETLEFAMTTVACYARIQSYEYRIIDDSSYREQCPQEKREFRRHCIVKRILIQYDYILFLIADIGVVNPRRRIEDFIDEKVDIVLYERFHAIELMAGSYLVRNSRWTLDFLDHWANYEKRLPQSFHGSDSGALYFLLAEILLPDRKVEVAVCRHIWSKSRNYADLFVTLSCVRNIIGETTYNGRVKILQKGTSWARDSFVTKGKWCPTRDFMLSDMKPKLRLNPIPLKIVRLSDMTHTYSWYGQLAGKIEIHRCHPRNSTWRYARPLIIHNSALEERFVLFHRAIHYVKMLAMTRTPHFVRGMSRKPEKYVFRFTGWADG